MDDLISRQAAIDTLHMHLMYRLGTDSNKKRLDEWINNLPSTQPTVEPRAKGHWIELPGVIGVAYCSECDWQLNENNTNFCPNCGADMRGEEE